MEVLRREPVAGGTAVFVQTDRSDGDLRVDGEGAERNRGRVRPGPWTWLRQVHGAAVVVVDEPGAGAGSAADAAVTMVVGAALAVHAADCAPVGLIAAGGGIGVAHAGWRGLVAGVLESAVDTLRRLVGDGRVVAVVGPCVGAADYEFGEADLALLVRRFGDGVRSLTRDGRPALDVGAAVSAALRSVDVPVVATDPRTTADATLWSHRLSGDTGRSALVGWLEPA